MTVFRTKAARRLLALLVAGATICAADLALAQRHDRAPGGAGRDRAPQWHGHIERFHEHDWGVWRGGRWVHGPHNGRPGWWWVVGTGAAAYWYLYPTPVYPYPSPWEPPAVAIVTPPGVGMAPPPPTQYWYYCEASGSYYPYVATCPGGWKQVPATPQAPAPALAPEAAPAPAPAR